MSYYIVEHDGKVHQIIDKKGKPNKYGEPKIFETMGAAINWCDRHTIAKKKSAFEKCRWALFDGDGIHCQLDNRKNAENCNLFESEDE